MSDLDEMRRNGTFTKFYLKFNWEIKYNYKWKVINETFGASWSRFIRFKIILIPSPIASSHKVLHSRLIFQLICRFCDESGDLIWDGYPAVSNLIDSKWSITVKYHQWWPESMQLYCGDGLAHSSGIIMEPECLPKFASLCDCCGIIKQPSLWSKRASFFYECWWSIMLGSQVFQR